MQMLIEFGYDGKHIKARCQFHPVLVSALKSEGMGQRWNSRTREWLFPANKLTLAWLRRFSEVFPAIEINVSARLSRFMRAHRNSGATLQRCRRATEVPVQAVDGASYQVEPWQHQVEALRFIHARAEAGFPWAGLLYEMGTGKTKVVCDAAELLGWRRVLVVCPKTVVISWERELALNLEKYAWLDATVGTGRKRGAAITEFMDPGIYKNTCRYVVMNYDSLWRPYVFEALTGVEWDAVVMDESTYIKTVKAKRTKAAQKLGRLAGFRLIMTGTPITNNYLDLYSQLSFLDESVLGMRSFTAFKATYAVYEHPFRGRAARVPLLVGYKNIDDLMAKVNLHCLIKRKEECLDLPPVTRIIRSVSLEGHPEIREAYNNMRKELLHIFEHEGSVKHVSADNVLVKILRMQQITSGYLTEDAVVNGRAVKREMVLGQSPKIEALLEFIQEIGSEEKVVIWARFRHDVDAICNALQRLKAGGIGVAKGGQDNRAVLKEFQATDKYRFLVATPGTCSFGVDLHAARYGVRYSASFSLEHQLQGDARIHRSGQTRPVTYVDIVCADTVDELVLVALQGKQDMLNYVMQQGKALLEQLPEL